VTAHELNPAIANAPVFFDPDQISVHVVAFLLEGDANAHAHCRRASVQRSGGRFSIVGYAGR
jgi:hypothetical protein